MNVTEKQKKILLNYMKDNEEFARGRLRYHSGNKKILNDMWIAIATSLNATGNGPQKQPKEWQKTWRDWKSNVLKKCAQNKSYAGATGGGPPKVLKLTELEENLLEIIGPEAGGLANIPEGGNFYNPMQRRLVPINDTIPENRDFFHTYGGSCDTIAQEVGLREQFPYNSMQIKRKCTSTLTKNKLYKIDDVTNNLSSGSTRTSTSRAFNDTNVYDTNFSAQEMESSNICHIDSDSEIDDIVLDNINTNTTPHRQVIPNHQVRSKATNSKENDSSAAIQLMRETLEVKQERLKISKEKLFLKKEMFEYFKSINSDYKDILNNIDCNIMHLKEEVEKIVPSYITE
ncbi:unnamed protein product [Lasius platythorax]|uniref:Regulatory protein zeste n=1 Tax=Lasius platythorax TaxID=488582 RepID=A0AAV2NNS3_9HYME